MTNNDSMNRRQFLKSVAVGTCGAACHNVFAPNGMVAYALPPAGRVKKLIEIFFYGGYCSYGLFPQHNAGAQARYPTLYRTPDPAQSASIGHPDQSLHVGFNSFVAQANLDGPHVALIVGSGALNSRSQFSRSHEEAQIANERVNLDYTMGTAMGVGAAIAQEVGHPYSLISFGGSSDFALGGAIPARSISGLANAGRPSFWQDQFFRLTENNTRGQVGPAVSEAQNYVQTSISGMEQNLATLQGLSQINPAIAFPNTGIGNTLRDITRLITANLGNVFFVPYGGFDTHSNQAQQHVNLIGSGAANNQNGLGPALAALVQNLRLLPGQGAPTAWDETVVITRTDFGRTFENNGEGTDHGLAHTQMIFGGPIRGGVYGDPADAAKYQNERNGYQGPNWVQFSAGQPTKEIVQFGMGYTNISFPEYVGNRYAPIGFLA